MTPAPGESGALWYDDDAGPMVRPYTVTRGRTVAAGPATQMDVIAVVSLSADTPGAATAAAPPGSAGVAGAAGVESADASACADASVGSADLARSAASVGSAELVGAAGSAGPAAAVGADGSAGSADLAGADASVGLAGPAGSVGPVESAELAGSAAPAASGTAVSASGAGADAPGEGAGVDAPDEHAGDGTPSARARVDTLGEEHLTLLEHCTPGPLSVADLAAEADLPLGVVRVLLADLVELGRVRITRPVAPAELPDIGLLQHLITGLRSL